MNPSNFKRIDTEYAAFMMLEVLYKKGLVNDATHQNICKKYDSHISQAA